MSQEKNSMPKLNKQKDCKTSLLNLPDVVWDYILERLSPLDLCRVARVCTYLRNRSRSDYLWENHIQQKWSRLLGEVAQHEWEWHRTNITKLFSKNVLVQHDLSASRETISDFWPFRCIHSYLENYGALTNLIKSCSKMALFICLETGRFWFPAQVLETVPLRFQYYDTLASYDSMTHTFQARFGFGHFQIINRGIRWDRLRIPPPDTFLRGYYYNPNCLMDLKPGDQIEIQTRRRNDFPYGWRLAIVAHLESCDNDVMNHCHCQNSDTLVVELNHGPPSKRLMINRNMRKELWDGFSLFGGIRKVDNEEIEKWNNNIRNLLL